jgi:hypothetical protein
MAAVYPAGPDPMMTSGTTPRSSTLAVFFLARGGRERERERRERKSEERERVS